jgi:NAD-dependent dihydropyrimidine dehydrogenase PreA subunit
MTMNPNIPGEQVNWQPAINLEVCTGDRVCIDFCKNDVFAWDEESGHPFVKAPLNCVLGCDSCAQMCPVGAITFPSKDELRATLRRLRMETHQFSAPISGPEQEKTP